MLQKYHAWMQSRIFSRQTLRERDTSSVSVSTTVTDKPPQRVSETYHEVHDKDAQDPCEHNVTDFFLVRRFIDRSKWGLGAGRRRELQMISREDAIWDADVDLAWLKQVNDIK